MMSDPRPTASYQSLIRAIDVDYARFNATRTVQDAVEAELEVHRFEQLVATRSFHRANDGYYNRLIGLDASTLPHLDAAFRLFADSDVVVRVDLEPHALVPSVVERLLDRGLKPQGTITFLVADALSNRLDPSGICIQRLTHGDADRFFDLLEQTGSPIGSSVRKVKAKYYCTETFRIFLALMDDQVAGWATSYVSGDAVLLGNAFTFQAFRGRGVHSALTEARLADAGGLRASYAVTDVQHHSGSHRNAERCGFRVATIVSCWA